MNYQDIVRRAKETAADLARKYGPAVACAHLLTAYNCCCKFSGADEMARAQCWEQFKSEFEKYSCKLRSTQCMPDACVLGGEDDDSQPDTGKGGGGDFTWGQPNVYGTQSLPMPAWGKRRNDAMGASVGVLVASRMRSDPQGTGHLARVRAERLAQTLGAASATIATEIVTGFSPVQWVRAFHAGNSTTPSTPLTRGPRQWNMIVDPRYRK